MSNNYKGMSPEEYIELRLENQIEWYDKKSISNQKWHRSLKSIEIVLAVAIPVILLFDIIASKYVASIFGAAISLLAGFQGLWSFHENWLRYRMSCEILRREKIFYLTAVDPYSNEEGAFELLVERVEEIINNENIGWREVCVSSSCKTQTDS